MSNTPTETNTIAIQLADERENLAWLKAKAGFIEERYMMAVDSGDTLTAHRLDCRLENVEAKIRRSREIIRNLRSGRR